MTALLTCRAGKMKLVEKPGEGPKRFELVADPRKGLLRVGQGEDGLVHIVWCERTDAGAASAQAEEDVIVFPGEASFEKVPNQRLLLLKFKEESDRNLFFWLQEMQTDDDESRRARFNAAINTPMDEEEEAEAAAAEAAPPAPPSAAVLADALAAAMSERAHASNAASAGLSLAAGPSVGLRAAAPAQSPVALDTASAASAGGSAAPTASSAQGFMAQMLSDALWAAQRNQNPGSGAGGGSSSAGDAQVMARLAAVQSANRQRTAAGAAAAAAAAGPSLSEILKPEALLPALRDPAALERLAPFLPEEHRTPEALASLAHSPQFQQQLHTLGQALQSGQLDLAQFGLRSQGCGAIDFLAAILELVGREQATAAAAATGSAPPGGGDSPAPMQD